MKKYILLAAKYEYTKVGKRRRKRKKQDGVGVYLCMEQRNWTKAWIHGTVDVNQCEPPNSGCERRYTSASKQLSTSWCIRNLARV